MVVAVGLLGTLVLKGSLLVQESSLLGCGAVQTNRQTNSLLAPAHAGPPLADSSFIFYPEDGGHTFLRSVS
jgi:hypothetical protein